MSERGLELLLALLAADAGSHRCRRCGASLAGAEPALRERTDEHVVAELRCPACGAAELVELRPAAEGGSAQVV